MPRVNQTYIYCDISIGYTPLHRTENPRVGGLIPLCTEKVRPGTGREAGLGHAPVSRICTWKYTGRGAQDVRERSARMAGSDHCAGCTGVAKAREGRERPLCRMHRCREGQGGPGATIVQDAPVSRRPGRAGSDRPWAPFSHLLWHPPLTLTILGRCSSVIPKHGIRHSQRS